MSAPARPEASDFVRALESVWGSIQRRHAEVPRALIILAPGEERGKLRKLGHWSPMRWRVRGPTDAPGETIAEVLVAGEGIKLGAREILDTLLHEAAHGVAYARGIKDCTRQGRYHNHKYKAIAEELGLTVAEMGTHGWAQTSLPDGTAALYDGELALLQVSLVAYRRHKDEHLTVEGAEGESEGGAEGEEGGSAKADKTLHICACTPPRKIRVSPKVAALGPIGCGVCGAAFVLASVVAAAEDEGEDDADEESAEESERAA